MHAGELYPPSRGTNAGVLVTRMVYARKNVRPTFLIRGLRVSWCVGGLQSVTVYAHIDDEGDLRARVPWTRSFRLRIRRVLNARRV